jgi:hypothetical protein
MLAIAMKTLTVRNVPDAVHAALRVRAARHGWSMEEEARRTLARSVEVDRNEPVGGVGPKTSQEEEMQGFAEAPSDAMTPTTDADALTALEELRALIRTANHGRLPAGVVDELIAERRAEAAREQAEHAESIAGRPPLASKQGRSRR